ncbi:thioredoxin family protein [Hyunsoonleella pacifica]|uniref:Thioredoxin family protein n=1 Tax=Hyunsoonleella pacifica TaxID=1080224 RepID=A0A4V2JAZ2_9FLAO|nr:thioredoxin family protein [Hyunsoonleella pacifica]TBN15745.1 thioredoxin family protein [Hyunsoonleella pacifica]GGD22246.1 thioredoxin [Hyunsoonleella pacifica]
MKRIIESGIKRSMSYEAYRALVEELAQKSATTGHNQSQALIHYTKLNDRRMKRWDKTLKVSAQSRTNLLKFNFQITWLVIAESWCGDAAHILPVLNKIAEVAPNIKYRVVLRDENPLLMDAFLTYGKKAIPKLIIIDNNSGEVLDTYGPRPSEATGYVNRFIAINGALTQSFKEDLQHWYNDNKGKNIIEDIIEILNRLQPSTVYLQS